MDDDGELDRDEKSIKFSRFEYAYRMSFEF